MPVFVVFLVHIFPHSDWVRRFTKYSVQMRENVDQKKTPITDTFYAVCLWKWFLVCKLRASHSAEVMTSSVVTFCLLTSVWKLNLIPYAEVDNLSATLPQIYIYLKILLTQGYVPLITFIPLFQLFFNWSLKPINIPVLCKKFSW